MGVIEASEILYLAGKALGSSNGVKSSGQSQLVPEDEAKLPLFIPAVGLSAALISPRRILVTGGVTDDERVLPFTVLRYLDFFTGPEGNHEWAAPVSLRDDPEQLPSATQRGGSRKRRRRDSTFPVSRKDHTLTLVPDSQGVLYLVGGLKVGGHEDGTPCTTMFSLDVRREQWDVVAVKQASSKAKADKEQFLGPRFAHSACYLPPKLSSASRRRTHAASGSLVVYGGYASINDDPKSTVHVFDIRSKKWSLRNPEGHIAAPARAYHACATLGNYLVVHGGNDMDYGDALSMSADLFLFDLETCQWLKPERHRSSAAQPTARRLHAITQGIGCHKDVLVMYGGQLDNGDFSDEMFTLRIIPSSRGNYGVQVKWERQSMRDSPGRPLAKKSKAMSAAGGCILAAPEVHGYLLIGGRGAYGARQQPLLINSEPLDTLGETESGPADEYQAQGAAPVVSVAPVIPPPPPPPPLPLVPGHGKGADHTDAQLSNIVTAAAPREAGRCSGAANLSSFQPTPISDHSPNLGDPSNQRLRTRFQEHLPMLERLCTAGDEDPTKDEVLPSPVAALVELAAPVNMEESVPHYAPSPPYRSETPVLFPATLSAGSDCDGDAGRIDSTPPDQAAADGTLTPPAKRMRFLDGKQRKIAHTRNANKKEVSVKFAKSGTGGLGGDSVEIQGMDGAHRSLGVNGTDAKDSNYLDSHQSEGSDFITSSDLARRGEGQLPRTRTGARGGRPRGRPRGRTRGGAGSFSDRGIRSEPTERERELELERIERLNSMRELGNEKSRLESELSAVNKELKESNEESKKLLDQVRQLQGQNRVKLLPDMEPARDAAAASDSDPAALSGQQRYLESQHEAENAALRAKVTELEELCRDVTQERDSLSEATKKIEENRIELESALQVAKNRILAHEGRADTLLMQVEEYKFLANRAGAQCDAAQKVVREKATTILNLREEKSDIKVDLEEALRDCAEHKNRVDTLRNQVVLLKAQLNEAKSKHVQHREQQLQSDHNTEQEKKELLDLRSSLKREQEEKKSLEDESVGLLAKVQVLMKSREEAEAQRLEVQREATEARRVYDRERDEMAKLRLDVIPGLQLQLKSKTKELTDMLSLNSKREEVMSRILPNFMGDIQEAMNLYPGIRCTDNLGIPGPGQVRRHRFGASVVATDPSLTDGAPSGERASDMKGASTKRHDCEPDGRCERMTADENDGPVVERQETKEHAFAKKTVMEKDISGSDNHTSTTKNPDSLAACVGVKIGLASERGVPMDVQQDQDSTVVWDAGMVVPSSSDQQDGDADPEPVVIVIPDAQQTQCTEGDAPLVSDEIVIPASDEP